MRKKRSLSRSLGKMNIQLTLGASFQHILISAEHPTKTHLCSKMGCPFFRTAGFTKTQGIASWFTERPTSFGLGGGCWKLVWELNGHEAETRGFWMKSKPLQNHRFAMVLVYFAFTNKFFLGFDMFWQPDSENFRCVDGWFRRGYGFHAFRDLWWFANWLLSGKINIYSSSPQPPVAF